MATTYTTADIVRDRLSHISGAALLGDTQIEANINMAEGTIDAVMQISGVAGDYTFSGAKHGIVRDTATSLAAFMCFSYDITELASTAAGSLVADMLWAEANRGLAILSDPNVVKFIKSV